MKTIILFLIIVLCSTGASLYAQIDSTLIRRSQTDTTGLKLNMDAVYNRPFLSIGKLPVALGGYVEANWQHLGTDGISEGHQFQMRSMTFRCMEYLQTNQVSVRG